MSWFLSTVWITTFHASPAQYSNIFKQCNLPWALVLIAGEVPTRKLIYPSSFCGPGGLGKMLSIAEIAHQSNCEVVWPVVWEVFQVLLWMTEDWQPTSVPTPFSLTDWGPAILQFASWLPCTRTPCVTSGVAAGVRLWIMVRTHKYQSVTWAGNQDR